MRSKVRKMLREYEYNNLKFELADISNLSKSFESLVILHQSRWSRQKESGAFGGSKLYELFFLRDILVKMYKRGLLKIYNLIWQDIFIGHQLYLCNKNVIYLFQEGYSWEKGIDSPGNILRSKLIKSLADQKFYIYNFMSGWTFHKKSWGAKPRDIYYIRCAYQSLKNNFYFYLYPVRDIFKGKIRGFYFKIRNFF